MGMILNRRRVMGKKGLLPSEYQEVEYIETDGKSYLNLNETATIDCEIGLDCYVVYSQIGYNQFFMGCRKEGCVAIIGIQPNLVYQFGNMAASIFTLSIQMNKRYKIVANNTGCYVDGTLYYPYSGGVSAVTSSNHIMLFATSYNTNDNIEFMAGNGFRVYSAYVKKNNKYVKKVIPCRRKSDNVLGMYDTVTNTFYTNRGTGTFIAGPDV